MAGVPGSIPPGSGAAGQRDVAVDALIDLAVAAINRGDQPTAAALASQVLAADGGNTDAEELLAAPSSPGEIRRLTILFADLVDSTALSTRVEPEVYHAVVRRYRDQVHHTVAKYEGHIGANAGDGILAVFGHPTAHEDDARRAVLAGLDILAEVARISGQAHRQYGIDIDVRVGVHRGLVYLDRSQDDVYGLAANLAARVSGLAPSGSVVVSSAVEALVRNEFEMEERPAAPVKGVDGLVAHHRVLGRRMVPTRPPRIRLVGRQQELSVLRAKWAGALAGTLDEPTLLITGEPGIGKSRLAAEALEMASDSGAAALELFGSLHHMGVGLHPVRVLLEQRCDITRHTSARDRLGLLRAELIRCAMDPDAAVPLLAPVLAVGPDHGYQPVAEGRRLEELIAGTVRSYLLACLGGGPGLVVAEDLQWFDERTKAVLGAVMQAGDGRLLVVLTSRDRSAVPSDWPAAACAIEPLTSQQAEDLIAALDPTLQPSVRADIRDRCDGVPFYLEQVVGDLRMAAPEDRSVPDSLYEPLFARLRAGDNMVPVVEAAAVIGREIDRSIITAVVDLDAGRVDEVLSELVDADVLEPSAPGAWRFRHELLREVVDELAPPSVRRQLHRRVAEVLIGGAVTEPDWQLVAAHHRQAELHSEAASAYQRATSTARNRGALSEARGLLTLALDELRQCKPGPDRDRREVAVRLERGYLTATAEGAQSPDAVADFERCLNLAGTDVDDDELVATLAGVGAYYLWRTDLNRVDQILELVTRNPEYGQRWFGPAIQSSQGIVAWIRGELDVAAEFFNRAIEGPVDEYDRQSGRLWTVPHDPIALAREHLGWHCIIRGDLTAAEAEVAGALCRADQLGYPQRSYNRLYAIDMEIWVATEAGQYGRARELVGDLIHGAEQEGLDQLYWQLLGATETAMVDARESVDAPPGAQALDEQITALTQVIEVWMALGASTYRPFYWCALGRLLTVAGRPEDGRVRLETALRFAEDSGVRFYEAELLRALAHTYNDPGVRGEFLGRAREVAIRQGATLFELRASLDDFALRAEVALAHVADAVAKFPVSSPSPELARARLILR